VPREGRPDTEPYVEAGKDPATCDLQWLRRAGQGDRAAFERLYLHHYDRLARFVARHTARRDLVDEIVNETMWVVWRDANQFRGEAKVATWIFGIAYRCLMKTLRDRPGVPESTTAQAEGTSDDAEQVELSDWVRRGLLALPTEQRMTMELAYYLGQSCEEIAAIMDVAVGTVKARLFHARLRLRNTLPALGGEDSPQAHAARG